MAFDGVSRHAPGVIVLPHVIGVRIDKYQGRHTFGMDCGISNGNRTGGAMRHQRDLFTADGVEYRGQAKRALVVLRDGTSSEIAARGSNPPALRPHRPREATKALGKVCKPGVLPEEIDRESEAGIEDEV